MPTLIITDLDAISAEERKSVRPESGQKQITANPVLKSWLPGDEDLDHLLAADETSRTNVGAGHGIVPFEVEFPEGSKSIAIPSTFEDAFILANTKAMRILEDGALKDAVAMTKALVGYTKTSQTVMALHESLFEKLHKKGADKGGFALDLLTLPTLEDLVPPPYNASGLAWLQSQMQVPDDKIEPLDLEAAAVTGVAG